jgi:hypothetical protein
MIRFLFRFVGLWILAAGFVFFVYDGTKSIAGNAIFITKLSDTWNAIHAASLERLQPAVEGLGVAWLWDPAFMSVLTAPTWVVFGVLGAILILIGRKKKRLIGYARN